MVETIEEINRRNYQLMLNSMNLQILHIEASFKSRQSEWKKEMVMARVKQVCMTSKKTAAKWFALEAHEKTMLENEEMEERERVFFKRKEILRLKKRVNEVKEFLRGESK